MTFITTTVYEQRDMTFITTTVYEQRDMTFITTTVYEQRDMSFSTTGYEFFNIRIYNVDGICYNDVL